MRSSRWIIATAVFLLLQSCGSTKEVSVKKNNTDHSTAPTDAGNKNIPARVINTKDVSPDSLVKFAQTLTGIKYKYGSAIKEQGFDCSGFISYVFNHFNISVPRSSIDFTNAGTTVSLNKSRKGDLILFTGSDAGSHIVGHMGIITENNNGTIRFIHSASGNAKGVMVSGMSNYFSSHFVKVIRVFN